MKTRPGHPPQQQALRRTAHEDLANTPVQRYFATSPFRSISFNAATVLLAFVFWGRREMNAIRALNPSVSNAILGLILLPVAVWIYSLFLYFEIRTVAESANDLPLYSRLPQLHRSLVFGVTLSCYVIIEALKLGQR